MIEEYHIVELEDFGKYAVIVLFDEYVGKTNILLREVKNGKVRIAGKDYKLDDN